MSIENGEKITINEAEKRLEIPDNPIIPFIEGDGTGPDIWYASQLVFDAAVEKAYGGKRKIHWHEVLAGEKAKEQTGEWLPQKTIDDITEYVMSLYDKDTGAFKGDKYGEKDGRFVYSALYILKITKAEMPAKSLHFIKRCFNYDGGFGGSMDAESHAAYIFCAVGALSILDKVDVFNRESIKKILAVRQTSTGGFNGRPEKLPDVCYSWWVLASVAAIGEIDDINLESLEKYILSCQDEDDGGFSDRPGNGTDIFHTFFALSALSLIDSKKYDLGDVDPVYAIPVNVKQKYIDN